MDAKHARNSTEPDETAPSNWPFGYVSCCSARLVLTNALVVIREANSRMVGNP